MQASGELPQLFERQGELLAGTDQGRSSGRRIGVQLLQCGPQGQRERHQALLCAVVEIALEAAALDVTGGDDPRSRRGELREPGLQLRVQAMTLRLLQLALCDVRVSDHVADDPAGSVPYRGGRDRDVYERSVLPQPDGLVAAHRLARADPREQLLALRTLRRRCHGQAGPAQHLLL